VRYFPGRGEVEFLETLEVEVTIQPQFPPRKKGQTSRMVPGDRLDLADLADNPFTQKSSSRQGDRKSGGGEGVVAHAIITSEELAPAFEPLAEARSQGGLPSLVFTTGWIYANYDGQRPDGGTDNATRIRNFIIDYYKNHDLRYVLLGGDADGATGCQECEPVVVPARMLQSAALFSIPIPSDLYYGCLDGSFDGDGDGIYGEPNDGEEGGDVDLLFEVHVGRAPVDSLEEARNFVRKTLAYEETEGAVLREILLVGEHLGFGGDYNWGGNLNDQIRKGSGEYLTTVGFENSPHQDFIRVRTLYDRDYLGQNWPPRVLVDALEQGVHIVNHVGHADISNVMKLTAADIDGIQGESTFIGYTQSCYAGSFDNQTTSGEYGPDSVVEHFLAGPSGAVAFIANSRRGWAGSGTADGPSQRFNRRFWDVVLRLGILQLGAANDRSREETVDYIKVNEQARWCAYQLNTLGDPALTLRFSSRRGSVAFHHGFYTVGDEAGLSLIDSDLSLSADELDTAWITVRAESSGDEETIQVQETGRSSGVFQGFIQVEAGSPAGDGKLQVNSPDTIIAVYQDEDDGSGTGNLARATVPAALPLALPGSCPGEGAVGVPYHHALQAEGGLPPHRYSAEVGYVEEISQPYFEGLGYHQNWSADEGSWTYALPFEFPFYGKHYQSVTVSSNGYIQLGEGSGLEFHNSVEKLIQNRRIALLWADLVTTEGDIFANEKLDSVTFRWGGDEGGGTTGYHTDPDSFVNAEVEIFEDGRIRFGYGSGNKGLSPTIGISAGDGERYVISRLSGKEELANSSTLFYPTRIPEGLEVNPESGEITGVPREVGGNDISFRVEDSVGQSARRSCYVVIRPNGLAIESPEEGDLWFKGSDQTIRWQWFGQVGNRVRLDYNIDGSTTSFPLPIAEDLPINGREFLWTIPDVEASRVRVRLQSKEHPEFFTYSEIFSIIGPTLFLLSPGEGELWSVGEEVTIRWDQIGEIGPRIRIRYNLDGSREEFPLLLADDVPNTGSLRVVVPATPSETCRLHLESISSPSATGTGRGTFPIRHPSITLLAPNGGECLRIGEPAQVTWSMEGDTGAEVILEYNIDGSDTEFPFLALEDPVPNRGTAVWTVPATVLDACRLRIRSVQKPSLADVSDGTFRLSTRCELRTLVWVPYIDTDEEQITSLLSSLRQFEPDAEITFSTVTGKLALEVDLEGRDALILPRQKQGTQVDFDALGRDLSGPIRDFLESGGSVVACHQIQSAQAFLVAAGLLEYDLQGEGSRLCQVVAPRHPLTAGIQPNFPGPFRTAWYDVRGPGVERLVEAGEGQVVVASRNFGFGRLSFLGFDYYSSNDATARILANAARLPLPQSGLRFLEPMERGVFLEGEEIRIRWIGLGKAAGLTSLSYNTDGSGSSFPHLIGQVNPPDHRGSHTWQAPGISGDASFLSIRLKAQSLSSPQHFDVTGPFYVIRPLTLETGSLPVATLNRAYSAELRASGGVPPHQFTVLQLPEGLGIRPLEDRAVEIWGVPVEECEPCEIEVHLKDALGNEIRESLLLSVIRREIVLSRPHGGELWLYGSTIDVRWTHSGDVGETVNIRFNTDGSTTEFPFLIAGSLPLEKESHSWMLPTINAPRCRLRVESNELPQFFSMNETEFSIVGPTIHLIQPDGSECWEAGRQKKILWQSASSKGETIRIEYNTDGSDEYPLLVAENVPDMGMYFWQVPWSISESCRVRVSFETAPDIQDASEEPFRIGTSCPLRGLLWFPCLGSAPSREEEVLAAITENEPDFLWSTSTSEDPSGLAPLLATSDVVIALLATSCRGSRMEQIGARFQETLRTFVGEGGVVVFCGADSSGSRFLKGLGLFSSAGASILEGEAPCEVSSYLHPVIQSIPLEFPAPLTTQSYELTGGEFEILVTSLVDKNPVAAARDEGLGRWVLLGFDFEKPDATAGRILSNAIRMRSAGPGLRVLSPPPGAVYSAGETVPIRWAARGGRSEPIRIFYNTDGSDSFPHHIADVEGVETGGTLDWTAPDPPAGDFFPCRVRVAWAEAPQLPASSEEVFYVVRKPLSVDTDSAADGYQGAPYSMAVEASGGVPPYTFEPLSITDGLFIQTSETGLSGLIYGIPDVMGTGQPLSFQVRDSLGYEANASFNMDIYPSRLEILSPAGGEFLVVGQTHELHWETTGYVGETVKIEYNTDGSTRDFPHLVADSVPLDTPFIWTVPETVSTTCRIRITSMERGISATGKETFAISRPGITCLYPTGAEILETDTLRSIRWRSLGNTGGRVRIHFNLNGSSEEFPVAIALDAPDTGEFLWTVPRITADSCRLRVQSTTEPALQDFSWDTFAIAYRAPVRGLIWIPYTDFGETEVRGAIAAATLYEHDFDWAFSKALTAPELESDLVGKDTFLMVQQRPGPDTNLKFPGRALGPVLGAFATRGGTVVLLKQIGPAREFLPAAGLLEARELGGARDPECRVAWPEHPVLNQVAPRFHSASATAWYEIEDPEVDVYATTPEGNPVVAGRDVGDGRVILIGFDYSDYTEDSARILANSLRSTPMTPRVRFVRGDANTDGMVNISDVIFLLDYLILGGPEPLCMDAADVDDSSRPGRDELPIDITDVLRLLRSPPLPLHRWKAHPPAGPPAPQRRPSLLRIRHSVPGRPGLPGLSTLRELTTHRP